MAAAQIDFNAAWCVKYTTTAGTAPLALVPQVREERAPLPPRAGKLRNSPCPCGSGKKYKRCCMQSDQPRWMHAWVPGDDVIAAPHCRRCGTLYTGGNRMAECGGLQQ